MSDAETKIIQMLDFIDGARKAGVPDWAILDDVVFTLSLSSEKWRAIHE
jgi:hypothetical protein